MNIQNSKSDFDVDINNLIGIINIKQLGRFTSQVFRIIDFSLKFKII